MTIAGVNCGEYECYETGEKRVRFAVQFNDGITIIYSYHSKTKDLEFFSMLSTGLESSYISTGKWPTKKSLDSRLEQARCWVNNNKNRYKLLKN